MSARSPRPSSIIIGTSQSIIIPSLSSLFWLISCSFTAVWSIDRGQGAISAYLEEFFQRLALRGARNLFGYAHGYEGHQAPGRLYSQNLLQTLLTRQAPRSITGPITQRSSRQEHVLDGCRYALDARGGPQFEPLFKREPLFDEALIHGSRETGWT